MNASLRIQRCSKRSETSLGNLLKQTKRSLAKPPTFNFAQAKTAKIKIPFRFGVRFEQFNLPFMKQDEMGVWSPSNGDFVAWFKDPDGNMLSVSQHNPANLER